MSLFRIDLHPKSATISSCAGALSLDLVIAKQLCPNVTVRRSRVMNDELYVGECPICGQGRQIVRRAFDPGTYFLWREECESEWADPSRLSLDASKPMGTFGRSRLATRQEMREHPWRAFVKNLPDL